MESLSQAISLLQSQKFPEAEQAFRQILENEKTNTTAIQHLAESQIQQQKFTDAIATLEEGLTISPDKPEFTVYLSQVLWGTGQKDKAIPLYEKITQSYPGNPEILNNMAVMYYEVGKKDEALKAFKEVVQLQPKNHGALFNVGMVHIEKAQYEDAIIYFKAGLEIDPKSCYGLKQLGMALHISGDIRKGLEKYTLAYDNYTNQQEQIEVLTLIANANRDLNFHDEARKTYEKVLELNPNNEQVKKNLKSLAKRTIPSWHFTMLADTPRNDAYDKAIIKAVKEGDAVLDIGTGSGLLSMMAARAGATEITAVEMVPELAEVARLVIADNKYNDVITVHEKRSTSLVVGKDMPAKANVVVSEILDAGLLGEGVIPSLRHAWANLLTKDAVCIPKAADVKAQIIQCDDYSRVTPVKDIQGFDLSAFNHFREEDAYLNKHSHSMQWEGISDVFQAVNVDFYNLPRQTAENDPNKHSLEVEITQDGRMHGVLFWFDLHLNDEIVMSSGPGGELLHWGQAMFMFGEQQEVKAGDRIKLTVLQTETLITFEKA